VGLWLMVGFGFATGLMDGFRFYGFGVMGLSAWVCGGLGLWVWVCRHGFVVGLWVWWLSVVALYNVWWVCGYGGCQWWLCAMCGGLRCGFAGMVVVGLRWTHDHVLATPTLYHDHKQYPHFF
jgi:hypothetical protein